MIQQIAIAKLLQNSGILALLHLNIVLNDLIPLLDELGASLLLERLERKHCHLYG